MSKYDSLRRDLNPSIRHRTFPDHFYCYDMDFIEYDLNCNPVGCFEYKHANYKLIDILDHQNRCQRNTADGLGVPYFIVVYHYFGKGDILLHAEDIFKPILKAAYYIIPGNPAAHKIVNGHREISERQFVKLLSRLRGENTIHKKYNNTLIGITPPTIRNYHDTKNC